MPLPLLRGVYAPAFGHDINVAATEVSEDPDTQVEQVIGMMRGYAVADSETPELARDARAAAFSGDPLVDVFYDVVRRLRFVPDEETAAPFTSFCRGEVVETLIRPLDMRVMRDPQGDCDDFAMTTAALLRARGVRSSFCTVAVDKTDPSRYSHVYVVVYRYAGDCPWSGAPTAERIALDTSHGDYPGFECPNPYGKRTEWPLDGGGENLAAAAGVLGLAGLAWWVARAKERREGGGRD